MHLNKSATAPSSDADSLIATYLWPSGFGYCNMPLACRSSSSTSCICALSEQPAVRMLTVWSLEALHS
eukprot:6200535-Pleurochrysis_carterae.AAC.5